MMDIGFIGLGAMGSGIVETLVRAGYRPRVWNRSRAPADALARLGARPVATAREAFSGDAVISMLADDDARGLLLLGLPLSVPLRENPGPIRQFDPRPYRARSGQPRARAPAR